MRHNHDGILNSGAALKARRLPLRGQHRSTDPWRTAGTTGGANLGLVSNKFVAVDTHEFESASGFPLQEAEPERSAGIAPLRAQALILITDCVALTAAAFVVGHARFQMLMVAGITVLLSWSGGLYRSRLHLSVLDDVPGIVGRALAASAVVAAFINVVENNAGVQRFALIAGCGIAAQIGGRFAAYGFVRSARSRGWVVHRTLILGGGRVAEQLAQALCADRTYGLKGVGFLDDDPLIQPGDTCLPHLGKSRDLLKVLAQRKITVLIVAFGRGPEAPLVDLLRACERRGCEVFVVPRLYEIFAHGSEAADHIGAVPVVRMHRPRLFAPGRVLKRAFDIAVSGTALVLLSPVLLVAATLVRIENGPGVLFRQARVGLDGVQFELLKFRSLRPVDQTEAATVWTIAHDNRLGAIGKFLRRTSIDELPQLWNVLRGDMSLVGPRPERPHFVTRFASEVPRYNHRHRVPCGLTGLAQISGLRGDTSIADRARYDNYYIENWSFWLDIKIALSTVREVIGARGG